MKKMSKKCLALLLSLLMLFSIVPMSFAEEGGEVPEHTTHVFGITSWNWEESDEVDEGYIVTATFTCAVGFEEVPVEATLTSTVTKEATCTEEGEKSFTAKVIFNGTEYICAEHKTATIDALGHSYVLHEETAETCTDEGNETYFTCENCEGIFDAEYNVTTLEAVTIPSGGLDEHTPSGTVKKYNSEGGPFTDCTTEGNYSMQVCSVCGAEFGREEIAKRDNHADALITTVDATCTEDGLGAHQKCTECGMLLTAATVLPKTGHTFNAVQAKDASCSEEGNEPYWYCSVCGKFFWSDEHEYTDEDQIVEEEGGPTIAEQVKIEKDPHEGIPITHQRSATCTEKGTAAVYRCSTCHTNYFEKDGKQVEIQSDISEAEIDALGHDWREVGPGSEEGYCSVECQRCDATDELPVDEVTHTKQGDFISWIAPTCLEGSYYEYMCSVCNQKFKEDAGEPALGHEFPRDVYTVIQEASCTQTGIKARQCTHEGCKEYATEDAIITGPTEHTLKVEEEKATCETSGYSRQVCEVCGASFNEVSEDALGHIDVDEKDAFCDRCGMILCDHLCHKTGIFYRLIWFIINVWNQFLGINKTCEKCGLPHYSDVVIPTVG